MIVIGLDLATYTGIAIGPIDGRPDCHTEILGDAGAPHGARFAQTFRLTKRLILEHNPGLVAIEEPIASGVPGQATTVKLLMGLRASVAAVCHARRVPFREYPVQTVRKRFIGVGNLPSERAKLRVFNRCLQLGWTVTNDNESDAAAVWDFARSKVGSQATLPAGLFDAHDQ